MHFLPDEVTKNSLVDYPRLLRIKDILAFTDQFPGDNAEVGVYKGGTAYLIAQYSSKHLHLFDTFEGMPEPDPKLDLHKKGDFSDTSFQNVDKLLTYFEHVSFYKGLFPNTVTPKLENTTFAFVHLDCDLYESVKAGLEFFWPRMIYGGVIVLDDYAEPDCPGAKLATHEFVEKQQKLGSIGVGPICQSQIILMKN